MRVGRFLFSLVISSLLLGIVQGKIACNSFWNRPNEVITNRYYNARKVNETAEDTVKLIHVVFRHGDRTPDLKNRYPKDPYNCPNGYGQLTNVFRHGDRTPDLKDRYPKDPYYNETYYPTGYGQLTNLGKQQEFYLGAMLRKRYDKFLGDIYTPEVMEPLSTDYNRTKMSLQLVLAGLWPPQGDQAWSCDLPWLPIPYNYVPGSEDQMLRGPDTCPALIDLYQKVLKSDEVLQFNEKMADFYKYMSHYTGLEINNIESVYNVFFTLFAEEALGLPLPQWTKCVWPYMVTDVAVQYYNLLTANIEIKRYSSGILIKKIIEDSLNYIEGKLTPKGRKVFLYSSHEVNVALTLIGLNVFYPHVPSYASYVVIELHQLGQMYGVKVLYQNNQHKDLNVLTIPGCDELCPFDKFYEMFKDIFPTNAC